VVSFIPSVSAVVHDAVCVKSLTVSMALSQVPVNEMCENMTPPATKASNILAPCTLTPMFWKITGSPEGHGPPIVTKCVDCSGPTPKKVIFVIRVMPLACLVILNEGCADIVMLVTPAPAPFNVMALFSVTEFKPQAQLPASIDTVAPGEAAVIAACTLAWSQGTACAEAQSRKAEIKNARKSFLMFFCRRSSE
jgi:hypothetical protein